MSVPGGTQVAERIYYDDAELTEFTAEVTGIREMARVEGRQVWQIALDRTAFYPTSGGQPYDTGVLTATARSGALLTVPVTEVEEDTSGEVWHTTVKPLQEGTVVHGTVDAARRRDHMQQHSGQHLLSAILLRDFGARTVSFHLGAQISTIDLEGGSLEEAALTAAEHAANAVIAQALPMAVRYVSSEEAERMRLEGLLRKLPQRTGRMRLVEIPGLDLNACGGTHVAHTAAIGPLLLRGTERVREALRLSFVCGDRALRAAGSDFQQLTALARALSTGRDGLANGVARLQAESRALAKDRAVLLRSLAEAEAARLAGTEATPVVHTLDMQHPGRDAAYAKLLASAIVVGTPARAALVIAPETGRCSVVLAAKPGLLNCGATLREALAAFQGRGGGSAEIAQGSLPGEQLHAFRESLARTLWESTQAEDPSR